MEVSHRDNRDKAAARHQLPLCTSKISVSSLILYRTIMWHLSLWNKCLVFSGKSFSWEKSRIQSWVFSLKLSYMKRLPIKWEPKVNIHLNYISPAEIIMVVLFSKELCPISPQSLLDVPEYLNSEFHNISVRNSSCVGQLVAHSSSLLMVFFEKLQYVLISLEFGGWGLISV